MSLPISDIIELTFGFGQYICWLFFIIGAVFVFQIILMIEKMIDDAANARFKVEPL